MEHTIRAVDIDLDGLAKDVAAMGDLAVAQVRAAVDAFQRHDLAMAAKVVRADDALDIQDVEIEKRAIRFIALRQPMADDLRRPMPRAAWVAVAATRPRPRHRQLVVVLCAWMDAS